MNKPPHHNRSLLDQAYRFAEQSHYEAEHSQHVMNLSNRLFEQLESLHALDGRARSLLSCSALLHDIGWITGQAKHHKQSMRMILSDRTMDLTELDRQMIAVIARYHRKALPKPTHPVYRDLTDAQRQQVQLLSALLRMADGLDRSHKSIVKDIEVLIAGRMVDVICYVRTQADSEMCAAKKKSDLFETATGYTCQFTSRISA